MDDHLVQTPNHKPTKIDVLPKLWFISSLLLMVRAAFKKVSQTTATTFAFSSVFILLLWFLFIQDWWSLKYSVHNGPHANHTEWLGLVLVFINMFRTPRNWKHHDRFSVYYWLLGSYSKNNIFTRDVWEYQWRVIIGRVGLYIGLTLASHSYWTMTHSQTVRVAVTQLSK